MSVAAVVLAAGASRRLGRSKQNVVVAGETLLHRTIRLACEASLSPVVVVTRPDTNYGETIASGDPVIVAANHEAEEGVASSIRCGVAMVSSYGVAGAILLACDQPALSTHHLRALLQDESRIAGSAYAGSIGVPAYFPAAVFPALLVLHGDVGARKLLVNAYAIPADDLELDVDTEHDLDLARALLEGS